MIKCMSRLPSRLLVACLLPLSTAVPAHADAGDVVSLRAGASVLWDDNLFRVPQGQKPQAEIITTTIAGVDVDKRFSRQEILAHVNWVATHYNSNSYLNSGNLNYEGKWLWAAGSSLTGELAADRTSAQNSFADFQGLRQRNVRTIDNQRFGLEYAFHPDWRVLGSVNHQSVINDHLLPQDRDYDATGGAVGIKYVPASGTWVSLKTRQSEGRYTKHLSSGEEQLLQLDDKFTDQGQEFFVHWQSGGHTVVNGRLEYLQRRHPNFSSRDFSGWTGQLDYLYQYTDKTALTATYQRSLNPYETIQSSYYVMDDLIFSSRWEATGKLAVVPRLNFSHRQYLGEIAPVPGAQRQDKTTRAGVDVFYAAQRWLDLKAGIAGEKRTSTGSSLDYTDYQLLLSAIAKF